MTMLAFLFPGQGTQRVGMGHALSARYTEARDALAPFAELEKSPEHIHTYRLTPLSLWNAAAAGMSADEMIEVLGKYSKFPLPTNIAADLADVVAGVLLSSPTERQLVLETLDPAQRLEIVLRAAASALAQTAPRAAAPN